MEIYNNRYNIYTPHFGAVIKREHVLEAASATLFHNQGIEGYKDIFLTLSGKTSPGHIGFRGYAIKLGEKISAKYPEIQQASKEIRAIAKANPQISKEGLAQKVKHIVDRFEPELDINI